MFEAEWIGEKLQDEREVAEERGWLVRYCLRLTGNKDEAEDLAQETLTTAWLHAETLQDTARRNQWLAAIARNRWRDWLRRKTRFNTALQTLANFEENSWLPDETAEWDKLENDLDQSEIVGLVERALSSLTPKTRTALVLHFIEDKSLAEIAARLGTNQNAVSMRLQRGKAALKELLEGEYTKEKGWAVSSGETSLALKKTRIWCPYCGRAYLEGRFVPDWSGIELRCPHCNSKAGEWITRSRNLEHILKGVHGFKPAWNRIGRLVYDYFTPILPAGQGLCLRCDQPIELRLNLPGPVWGPPSISLETWCPACHFLDNESLETMVLSSPEGQAFWTAHPRFEARPVYQIETEGRPVIVKEFTCINETASLTAFFDAQTLALWRVFPT